MHEQQQTITSGGSIPAGPEDIALGEVVAVETRACVPVVTIRVPDPAALGWEKRQDIRESLAYTARVELDPTNEVDVGVDVLPLEDRDA